MPYVPFPQRLQRAKMEEQFSKFLDMFKKIEINIPFAEALAQLPNYAKFMKDILSKKRRFAKEGVVSLTATCNAVIKNNLPLKMLDSDSFTIPCTIGNFEFGKALCDSGASINLMPLSIVKRPSLGELTSTTMTLQMADRTMAKPEGVLEDVLIKVGKFIFLVDFLVMDMEEDTKVPLLLRRPFLATGAILIDVKKGELTLRVGDETIHFNMHQSVKQSDCDNAKSKIVEQFVPISPELINDCKNQNSMNENEMNFQYIEAHDVEYLNSNFEIRETILSLKEISAEKSSSSEEKGQEVEKSYEGLILKELPKHLKYAFLRAERAQPIVIATNLTIENEQKLIRILRKYKEAIAWSVEDLKEISPSICMHKILLEENAKISIEHQRRLNPVMKEVVRNEVLKWMNARFIYAISANP